MAAAWPCTTEQAGHGIQGGRDKDKSAGQKEQDAVKRETNETGEIDV